MPWLQDTAALADTGFRPLPPVVGAVPLPLRIQKSMHSYGWPMPVEVVSHIFAFASHASHDPASQSMSLSHVCKQWRQIALSTPSLWTFIHLSLPLSNNQLTRAYTWIVRSRHRPLDIYMDFRDPSWDWEEESHVFDCRTMENIMRFLVPQASRWRHIELLTDTWAPIFTFLTWTMTIESAPFLETVRLARCNEYFVTQGETFRPASLAFPVAWFRGGASLTHLRHVSLSGVHVDWAHSGLTDLRELELRYHSLDVMPSLSEFRRILCANMTLERLAIIGWGPRMDAVLEDEPTGDLMDKLSLPLLEELEFGFVDVTYAAELLTLFALPKMRVLSIEDVAYGIHLSERQDCSQLFDHLVEMITAKPISPCLPLPRLRELTLRNIHANKMSIHGIFGNLCSMTSLSLERVDTTTLLAICSTLDACNQLRVLTLKGTDTRTMGFMLSAQLFPLRLRILLDIDDDGTDDEEGVTLPATSDLRQVSVDWSDGRIAYL